VIMRFVSILVVLSVVIAGLVVMPVGAGPANPSSPSTMPELIYFFLRDIWKGEPGEPGAAGTAGGGAVWMNYAPALTWTTGTPAAITTIARYSKVGTTVHFTVDISSADSNGATDLTISLPVAPVNNANRISVTSIQRADV